MKRYFDHIENNEVYYQFEYQDQVFMIKQDRDRLWLRVSPIDDFDWFNEIRPWLLENPTPYIGTQNV